MMIKQVWIVLVLLCMSACAVAADVAPTVSPMFSDHMVILAERAH